MTTSWQRIKSKRSRGGTLKLGGHRRPRPDLSVDGTVVIEQLDGVNYMGRPAYGQAESRGGILRIVEDGAYAQRATVLLGWSSVNEIEIRRRARARRHRNPVGYVAVGWVRPGPPALGYGCSG